MQMEAIAEPRAVAASTTSADWAEGQMFLGFRLGEEEYALDILRVREIIGMHEITRVPQTPECVMGVINLRGKVIPVIDLRRKFELPISDYDQQTCIIVVDVGMLMGIIVDTVQEVHDIAADHIEPAPEVGTEVQSSFIRGMGKVGEDVVILLDIDEVLNSEELVELALTLDE
jgi:purine-binding chemotaxis protein CheW